MDDLRLRLQERLNGFSRLAVDSSGLRRSAIAIVVVTTEPGNPGIVMTRRASRLGEHPGQYAFPGGRLDPGESGLDAARRELREEVGLDVEATAVMRLLDDDVTRSGYVMTPVVLWGGRGDESTLKSNEAEVEEAFVVQFADLGREPNVYAIPKSARLVINVPFLDSVLHAPSGAIMHQFAEVVIHGRVTRVADYEQPVFRMGNRRVPQATDDEPR